MKRFLFLITLFYSLNFTAQEVYPLQPIERTSFYAEPLDEPTYTELPSGSITTRESGANTIGLTTGELSVSGSGAAVYTVPIAVPKGIGGVAPTLALTYNSQSGNGIAGYGWHLAGLSVISRVGSTMYHNGKITEVNLTNTDQFALDGQRLILKEGTHGESGAVYETESFSQLRIKAVGRSKNSAFGPDYFEVLYPDGSKAYYGKDNNSQSPMEYAISYWENAQGVSIRYFYKEEGNCIYISRIEYGGKGENNLHRINFVYKEVPSKSGYVGGILFVNKQRLSGILTNDNNIPYHDYLFFYTPNSLGYEQLISITEYVRGKKKTPILFRYSQTANGFRSDIATAKMYLENIGIHNSGVLPLDADGDSYTDFLLYINDGENAFKRIYIFDDFRRYQRGLDIGRQLDLDYTFQEIHAVKLLSKTGVLLRKQGFVTTQTEGKKKLFKVYTKTLNYINSEYEREWQIPNYTNDAKIILGDFNGDGLSDFVAVDKHSNKNVHWIDLDRRKETDYTKTIGTLTQNFYDNDIVWAIDINGNGKTNLVHVSQGVMYVYEMDKDEQLQLLSRFQYPYITTNDKHPIAGDYNGDGKMDFLLPKEDWSNSFILLTNTGKGFVATENEYPFRFSPNNSVTEVKNLNTSFWGNFDPEIVRYQIQNYYSLIPIDVNNDGRTDIVTTYSNLVPNRFESEKKNTTVTSYINLERDQKPTFTQDDKKILSIKGIAPHIVFSSPNEYDRSIDISFFGGNKIETVFLQKNNKEDMMLRKVVNGVEEQNIFYQPLSSTIINIDYNSFYIADSNSESYPYVVVDELPSMNIVRKLERTLPSVEKTERSFAYYKAVTHAEGLGFLGFTKMSSTNWYEAEKQYEQGICDFKVTNPHLRGALVEEYLYSRQLVKPFSSDPWDSYFQKTSYQYTHTLSPNKVFKLQLTQQTTEDKLSELTTTNNFTYDSDGNLTEQRTQTDGYSQSTRISYLPKSETPYFVGLPQKKETTTTLASDSFSTAETFAYDKGLLTTHKTQGNGTRWRTTSYGYDEYGNVTEQTVTAENGEQRTKRYTYDPTHRLVTSHTDHEGQVTKFSYNNKGLLERKTSPLGQTTLYTYDLWGRPIQTTDFLGKKTTTHYEFNGSIFKTITENEEGTYSAESYNTLGWLLEKESNDAFNNRYAVSYEYNGIGQQVAVSTPHLAGGASQRVKRTEYDVYGRPTSITSPEGKVTRFTYDKLKTTADDGQQQIISTRDAQGNIVEHQDNGGTVRYTYFANGNLKTADYGGAVQRITQDGWGRKTSLTDPSAGRYTYQYDAWGNLTEETTPKGKTTFNYAQGTDRLTEKHITGDYTDMRIRYTYNADKLLTQIDNQNKDGNNDSYRYEYNGLKQLVQTTETNPQAVFTKNYTYDAFGRVQQETTTAQTAGKRVSSAVQYRYQNGELVEMKDDKGITLWKLTESNEYGQPLSLHKGKTKELLDYNSHFPKTQTVKREDTPLNVLQYDFNPQRGLLNHRTYSFYNQKEEFAYDTTDRLTRWGNATHQYDERGRITENSAIGTYEYTRNGYQQQKLTTNEVGETYLEKYPLPVIRYNAFKAPEQIYVKDKERISYEYNAFGERSHCYYGNAEVEKAKRPMLKHYSHDGSVEIVCNKTDNSTKFILYLGGDAYSAPAVLISDGETQKLYYLHRDYLGSIVMLTDEDGNIAGRRHFDPWGQPIKVEDGAGNTLEKLTLLDRGFTGHEHLQTVGLIHMNGRLYDPALHRFLQPDNYVQDPFNTQNFNRYGYCMNNPLVYVDENGEFIITAIIVGAIVGAVVGAYIGGSQANGTYNPFRWDYSSGNTWLGIGGGALIGGVSGAAATYVGGLAATGLATYGITGGIVGGAAVGAASGIVGGAISGGFMSLLPGGNGKFWSSAGWGALSGFVGGAILGGATGALTTPKGHNIWTGREIPQPVQTLETTPMGVHLDVENNITGNLELKAPTSVSLEIQQPKLISIETPDRGIRLLRMGNTDINSLQGEVRNNFKRFISKIPANSKTNATWRVLDDGNYLFQTISPGKVPGSTALYEKIVSPQGETLKMIKTTFSPQGDIIHIKSKL